VHALLNNRNGFDLIFWVKSHHHQVFPNGQFLVSLKIVFPIFQKLKRQSCILGHRTLDRKGGSSRGGEGTPHFFTNNVQSNEG